MTSREPFKFNAPGIQFLGEQNGPPERVLKARLSELLEMQEGVVRAYLAKASLGYPKVMSVVLAIRMRGNPDASLIDPVGTVFASVFNAEEHLDITFLTDDMEKDVQAVCEPFFQRAD